MRHLIAKSCLLCNGSGLFGSLPCHFL